jgi:hypothetical protein
MKYTYRPNLTSTRSTTIPQTQVQISPAANQRVCHEKLKVSRAKQVSRYEKPWLEDRNPRRKWERIIFWGSIGIGFVIGALICYMAYASVTNLEVSTPQDDGAATKSLHSTASSSRTTSRLSTQMSGIMKFKEAASVADRSSGQRTIQRTLTLTLKAFT